MINENMQKAINDQINAEAYSAYLYLSMSAYFESLNLKGMANWMYVQTLEESTHANKFYHYINQRGGRVTLKQIETPQFEWKSPLEAFEAAYKHEQLITQKINNLSNMAVEIKDHATLTFLQWFVNEQVEEEDSVNGVVNKLKLTASNPAGLFMIDNELAQRTFVPPPGMFGGGTKTAMAGAGGA